MHRTTSRHARALLAFLLLAGAVIAVPSISPRPSGASTDGTWSTTGIIGGGYVSSVSVAPDDPQRVVAVTDISGIVVSRDGGRTWRVRNNDIVKASRLSFADVTWYPNPDAAHRGWVFAFSGWRSANSGGVFLSRNYGETWELVSTVPTASGNNNPDTGLPNPHPRSIGQLLAIDTARGFVYAGTFKQGVMRASLANLAQWTTIALAPNATDGAADGYYIRSLTIDDGDPSVLYASTYAVAGHGDGRVWRISNAHTASPAANKLTNSPLNSEDLLVLGGTLFSASKSPVGVSRLANARSAAANTPFGLVAGLDLGRSETVWFSLAGWIDGGTKHLWVGAGNAPTFTDDGMATGRFLYHLTSTNDFVVTRTTESFPQSRDRMHNDVGGPNPVPRTWWKRDWQRWGVPGLDPQTDIGDIEVRAGSNTMFVSGPSGIWRSTNGGEDWYPVVDGILNTVSRQVVVDPTDSNKVYQGNVDYRVFASSNRLDDVRLIVPGGSSADGWALAVDPRTPGTVYLAVGDRDTNTGGQVWQLDPHGSAAPLLLANDTTFGGRRPIGIGVAYNGPTRVLVALVQNDGMYRKVGDGSWTKVRSMNGGGNAEFASVSLAPDGRTFYVYERVSGLWRGDAFGESWTQLFASTGDREAVGYAQVDPGDANTVFVADGNGLHRISNALRTPSVTTIARFSTAGALAISPRRTLVVATRRTQDTPNAKLLTMDLTEASPSLRDIADDTYRAHVNVVNNVAVAADGTIYVATQTNGTIRFDPTSAPTTTSTAGPSTTIASATTTTTRPAATTTTTRPATTTTTRPATTTTTAGKPQPPSTGTYTGRGYHLATGDGRVFTFGDGTASSGTLPMQLNHPVVGLATTPSGEGQWLVATDGGIFTFGDAQFYGSTGAIQLNQPIVGMSRTASGRGYWLVARDGGIFSFGDARFHGSTGAIQLNQPIVGMTPTPTGNGYWLVARDGGIFSFGDARFYGSTGAIRLNQPIVGMTPTPTGNGYWLVASDGGIFSFGEARFHGSTGAIRLNQPITGMAATPTGTGYWLVAADGGIFTFGDAQFHGSAGAVRLDRPVIGISLS